MVRRVLVEGTEERTALANTLSDNRFRELADIFRFNKDGTKAEKFDWSQELLDDKVVRYTNIPGEEVDDIERLADYFQQKIPRDIVVAAQIILDPALYRVASVAFEVPSEILNGPADERVEWFEENIDIDKLNRPNELQDIADKFIDKVKEQETAIKKLITDKYARVNFETDEGDQNEGVRLALIFQRTAKDISDTYEILGSPPLYKVVRTVLGLPESLVGTDIDNQAALINRKFDIKKFQDPDEVSKFVKKFVALYDVLNNTGAAPTVQLFSGGANTGISGNLLTSFSSLRLGG